MLQTGNSKGKTSFLQEKLITVRVIEMVFSPDDARERIEPGLTAQKAEDIARKACRPANDFEWYPVGKAVGSVKNQGVDLIKPFSN